MNINNKISKFKACFDYSPLAFCVVRLSDNEKEGKRSFAFLYKNEAMLLMTGRKKEELEGRQFQQEKWLSFFSEVAFGGKSKNVVEYRKENDKYLNIQCYQVEPGYCACLFTDVSEQILVQKQLEKEQKFQKRVEQALRESEIMYRIAVQNFAINMWEYDTRDKTLHHTETSAEVHKSDALMLSNYPECVIEKGAVKKSSIEDFRKLHERVCAGEAQVVQDIWFQGKDEKDWWCERITYTNILDKKGRIVRTIGAGKNITDEIKLKAERKIMDTALDMANIYIWEFDMVNKTSIQQTKVMEEYNVDAVIENVPQAIIDKGIVHPDSVEDYIRFHEAAAGGAATVSADIHLIDGKGKDKWQHMIYNTVFDGEGRPVRAVGCSKDITDRIVMERRFQEEMKNQEAALSDNLLARALLNVSRNLVEKYTVDDEIAVPLKSWKIRELGELLAVKAADGELRSRIRNLISTENLLKCFSLGNHEFSIEYQRKQKDETYLWVRTAAKIYQNPNTGDVMCFIYTYNINEQKTAQIMVKRIADMEYDQIALIDVIHDTMRIQNVREQAGEAVVYLKRYSTDIVNRLKGYVVEEQEASAIELMSMQRLVAELEKRDTYVISFDVMDKKGKRARKKYQYCYLDSTKQTILVNKSDVTELFYEQERQQQVLKEALAQAEQASIAKSAFLSRMSHEIRTPMNAIIGMSTLAAQSVNNPEQVADCLSKVGISARFLLSLINDILDMSRIESGKIAVKKEKFPFEEFINGINGICYEQANAKGVDYDAIFTSFMEDYYIGDAMKLQQVLLNIIANAIKFTPRGGKVQFIINQERVRDGKAHLHFVINDTGIGISEEFLPRIFEPFEQENAGITSTYGGTGLGLAICKNLIDMMGGRIIVNSIEGVGTEFTVDVELDLSDETKKNGRNKTVYPLDKLSALIVDDEIMICEQTKRILVDMGMKAEWVDSGMKAVQTVVDKWERQEYFDVILVDWKMPGMDGIETVRRIRKIVGPDVTIIIMTAYDWVVIEAEAKRAGVNILVSKPLFKSSLVSAFQKIFSQKEQENQESQVVEYDFTGKRVLLVEDHVLNIEVAKRLLESRGITVEVAENGLASIEMFVKHEDGYFDAILMDIRMPVMDGLTAAKAIRHTSQKDAATVPIIAMSANAFDEDVEKSKAAGMNAHLAKPIEPQILYRTLSDFFDLEEGE